MIKNIAGLEKRWGVARKVSCGEAWVRQSDYERFSINALGNSDGTGFREVVFRARRVDILSKSDEDEAEGGVWDVCRKEQEGRQAWKPAATQVVSAPSRLFKPIAMIAVTSRKLFNAPSDKMCTSLSPSVLK